MNSRSQGPTDSCIYILLYLHINAFRSRMLCARRAVLQCWFMATIPAFIRIQPIIRSEARDAALNFTEHDLDVTSEYKSIFNTTLNHH